jgi:hypothetical protein
VDEAIRRCSRGLQRVEIGEIATTHLGAGRGHRGGGLVRPRQPADLVAGREQFRDDIRAGVTGMAGDEECIVMFLAKNGSGACSA